VNVGLIGLGLLGSAIAERVEQSGFGLIAYDIDSSRTRAATAAEAAAAQVILLSLPHSAAVAEVLEKIQMVLKPGQIVVDTSTGDPDEAVRFGQQLEAGGVAFIDAAIAGSSQQLRQREVNVLAGGEATAVDAAAPVLGSFAQRIFHIGPCGSGARMKLVSNLVLGLNRAVLAEGLAFAEAIGIDPALALEVFKAGSTYSRVMDIKGEKMLAREYTPEARLSQHLKDVRLMLKHAPWLPLTALHEQLLARAEQMGLGASDNSAIREVFHRK
jgi:3-hydroxyisobutyrate dehydrogenase-like beta-hydroxyacid dehydrogenase